MKSYKTKLRTNIPIKAINLATQSTKKAKMSLKGTKKTARLTAQIPEVYLFKGPLSRVSICHF